MYVMNRTYFADVDQKLAIGSMRIFCLTADE